MKQSQVNGLSAPASPSLKGKETAYTRDTDAVVISPIIKNEMGSSSVDVLAASASTSKMTQASATNDSVVIQALQEAAVLGTTRSSSEELTDIEELDKALTSVAKKAAPRKRKAKGKEVAKAEDENHNEAKGENGAGEPKPKAKRKRTKKVQGPYLPVVDYPARDLEGKLVKDWFLLLFLETDMLDLSHRKFIGAHVSISGERICQCS